VKKEAEQRERDLIAAAIQIRRHKVDEIRRLFKQKSKSAIEAEVVASGLCGTKRLRFSFLLMASRFTEFS
jgi:hypothetical protein